jgi:hypothetical protein
MKHDKNLIRDILFYAANQSPKNDVFVKLADLPIHYHGIRQDKFIKHCEFMMDYKLVKGSIFNDSFYISSITWEGYEVIDNAHDDTIWSVATEAAGNLSWNVFTNVLIAIATNYALSSQPITSMINPNS